MLSLNTTAFDTNSTPIPVNSMSTIFSFLLCFSHQILRVHFNCGNLRFRGFFFFFFNSCFDICTIFPTGSMSSPMGTAPRFRVVVGLTSDALCQTRFPTVDSLSQNYARHLSHCGFLQTSLPSAGEIGSIILEQTGISSLFPSLSNNVSK